MRNGKILHHGLKALVLSKINHEKMNSKLNQQQQAA
jgi:hypothetical protein